MLTFILVVVLGGGVGLLVVSLAESEKPATDAGGNERAEPPEPDPDGHDGPEAQLDPAPDPESEPELESEPEPEPAPEPERTFAPLPAPPGGDIAGRARRPSPASVPSAFVAVEGTFAEVAGVPLWRRALAVAGILVIAVVGGVFIAALLAAAIGAVAEVLGNTIG